MLLKPNRPVGIVGYGAYIPRYRLPGSEVDRVWREGDAESPVREKAVPGPDEDTATMSIEAARNALARAGIDPAAIRAVWVGSESHPYAVKPTSTIVAEAIGAVPATQAADWEFACKAGTEAFQAAIGFVGSGMADYALAIGMDTAQGRPGDALEYTAGAGGAAFLVGPAEDRLAVLEGSFSYVTDTPDFFRRPYQHYPQHGSRFTGDPAYFKHVLAAGSQLHGRARHLPRGLCVCRLSPAQPQVPGACRQAPGLQAEQTRTGLLCPLDRQHLRRLLHPGADRHPGRAPSPATASCSFPSARAPAATPSPSGSPIRSLGVLHWRPVTEAYVQRRKPIDYGTYVRYRKKLHMH